MPPPFLILVETSWCRWGLLCFLLSSSWLVSAQDGMITGRVSITDGTELPGIYVRLDSFTMVTDASGRFLFRSVVEGTHELTISYVGFQTIRRVLLLRPGQHLVLELYLEEATTQLDEVTVSGQSTERLLRESTANVSILETEALYLQSNNTSDILKRLPGVYVRQTGGFGSEADISINGISGKQVKLFLDGVPLAYYGAGLGLNVLPVNLMERIEVYKGVVPVQLGADALGGAINVVSRRDYGSYADVSYTFGSFNSNRFNFNGQFADPGGRFLIGLNSFYNHSDNDYPINVTIPNTVGNPEPARVRRFHDRFSNHLINVYGGVTDRKYADKLIFSLRHSGLVDDVQHNAIMAQPYGEAFYREATLGVGVDYAKKSFLPQTDIRWYLGANHTTGEFVDTTLNVYTWDGKVNRRRTDGGELSASGSSLLLRSRNAISRINLEHEPWPRGRVTLNVFSSWFKRTGEDPRAADFYGQDYYANPTTLVKNATGVAYEQAFGGGLISYTSLKHFGYAAEGYSLQNLEFRPNEQSVTNFGYGQSFRYRFTERLLAKASYEYATRLPDETELFGDFVLVRPNPFLEPEQSHNANLGGQYRGEKVDVEVNGFYRYTDNIIWLRTSQFFAQYQNLLAAMTRGLDAEVRYRPFAFLRLTTNATYQDIRNRSPRSITGSVDDRYYDARLPNMPYLFGNAEVRYQKERVGGSDNLLSAWWSVNYVHEFFLFWNVDGNPQSKNIIPTQFLQNLGVSYALPDNRWSLALEVTNLLDQAAFDNFSVQRPGRAFFVTARHYLNYQPTTD